MNVGILNKRKKIKKTKKIFDQAKEEVEVRKFRVFLRAAKAITMKDEVELEIANRIIKKMYESKEQSSYSSKIKVTEYEKKFLKKNSVEYLS